MTLKKKLNLIVLAISLAVLLFWAASYFVFQRYGEDLDMQRLVVKRDAVLDALTQKIVDIEEMLSRWDIGDDVMRRAKLKALINEALSDLDSIESLGAQGGSIKDVQSDLQSLATLADRLSMSQGQDKLAQVVDEIFKRKDRLASELDLLHKENNKQTQDYILRSSKLRDNIMLFLIFAGGVVVLTGGGLMLVMKRTVQEPYERFLEATERVSSGDLSYRISSDRTDEFGIISKRFDSMVDVLEAASKDLSSRLQETELLLEVTRIGSLSAVTKDVLSQLVERVQARINRPVVAVFLTREDKHAMVLESSSIVLEPMDVSVQFDSRLGEKVLGGGSPFVINDIHGWPPLGVFAPFMKSALIVPIQNDYMCQGMFLIGATADRGFSEGDTKLYSILANAIGAEVRSLQLNEDAGRQVRQLRAIFDLNKALTSVYETEKLLDIISSKVGELLGANGCMIRLMDKDGMLVVKSSWGNLDEATTEPVPVGKGVAGWVAKEGRSLIIEDFSSLPPHMRLPETIKKSAIAVPLKKGNEVMGTIGCFDKIDSQGNFVPFSMDDLALAEGFASISALAIEKARMLEEEHRARMEITDAKKRLEIIFDSVQGGIVVLDRNYTILAANKYLERWANMPIEKVINASALEVFHAGGGVCPHCAAKATIEEGVANTITQSKGINYADLSSYPIKDAVGRVVGAGVFVQDITDRVLYQEEIMSLYRENMNSKKYIEGIINNSADAIVTTDLEGLVTSWNPAAEAIYGFKAEEAVGKFLPFIPGALMEMEYENFKRLKAGEVLKLETIRKRKDEQHIEVNLTLSPIKDEAGEIIGISGISKDITERRRVDTELLRRNQELSRLQLISSAMRSTLELDKLLRMVLTAVTMSDGLGFNRAILFLVDEESNALKGSMGVGPSSHEEAWKVWESLSLHHKSLQQIVEDIDTSPTLRKDSFLDRLCSNLQFPLDGDSMLARAARAREPISVEDVNQDLQASTLLVQQLGTNAYAVVPLVSRGKVIGVLWVDNLFNRKQITAEDIKFLQGFANQVASAIESARLFRKVSLAEAELENIFRSISDMVFFTEKDYSIKNVNQAVLDRLGLDRAHLIGRKCYEIFHGTSEPPESCPHLKTMEHMRSFVEEKEEPHLGGTFLTSTSPIFDAERNFLGTVHVVRDITEIKALQERLLSTERMATLGEVAAKVAHEIRNPLVSVGGFARRLEGKLDGELKDYAHIISNEVRRLEHILREILGFVREVRMSRKVIDLNVIVSSVVKFLEGELAESKNHVIQHLSPEPIVLYIDPDRLREAIMNIVSNANHATEAGTITITTYAKDTRAVLEVQDTGIGVTPENLTRIFDPFFTTRPTGTGLGLAISKRIMEENSGTINVISHGPGTGAKFIITIPLKEAR